MSEQKIDPQKDAFLVVDLQQDFCPGGALSVPEGDAIVPVVNKLLQKEWLTIASRDWHPPDHCSFQAQGGPWPPHCVQNTKGAEFHPELEVQRIKKIISKATSPDKDAYSAFEGTELASFLHLRGIRRLFVAGLATDYCVQATVLDALKEKLEVFVITDAIRGVNLKPEDSQKALETMKERGACLLTSSMIKD